MRIAVSGIPRGYQFPRPDGNWLSEAHRAQILAAAPGAELIEVPAEAAKNFDEGGVEVFFVEGGNTVPYPGELDWADYERFFTRSLRWVQMCSTGFTEN